MKVKDAGATVLVNIQDFDYKRKSFRKLFVGACGDAESFCNVWFQKRTEGRSEEGMQLNNHVQHWHSTIYWIIFFLDSDSDEMDSGNGDSATTTQDGDDDLLSSSICHFQDEIGKKQIGNSKSYTNTLCG